MNGMDRVVEVFGSRAGPCCSFNGKLSPSDLKDVKENGSLKGSTKMSKKEKILHWNWSRAQHSYRRPTPFRSQKSNNIFILLDLH